MPPSAAVGWFQETLVPPDRVHLRFDVYIVGAADTVGITATLWDGAPEVLAGIQARGFDHREPPAPELIEWMRSVIAAAGARCTPF